MSSSKVQEKTGSSGGTNTLAITPDTPLTPGNILVLRIGGSTVTNALCNTPTGTGTSGWIRAGSSNGGTVTHSECWLAVIGSSPSGAISVGHATAHNFRGNLEEWSGLTLTGATGIGRFNAASLAPITNSLTPTSGAACVLFAQGVVGTGALSTPTNSFTAELTFNTTNAQAARVVPSASGSSYSTGWTSSVSTVCDTTLVVVYETTAPPPSIAFNPFENSPFTGFVS